MLDRLPASVRHFILVFVGAAGSILVSDITAANGVTNVAWVQSLTDALNAGVLASVGVLAAMYLTPMTRQYGIGSLSSNPDNVTGDAEGDSNVEDNKGD
jgi:hypothetical protein